MEWSLFIKLVVVSLLIYYLIIIAYDLLFSGKSFSAPSQNVYDVKSLIDDEEAIDIDEFDQEESNSNISQPYDDFQEDHDPASDRSINSLQDNIPNNLEDNTQVSISNIQGQGYSMQEYLKIAREKALRKATAIAFD